MAFVIANELGVNLKQTSGPVIEKAGDTAVTGTAEAGSTVEVTLPDGTKATATADQDGNFSVPVSGFSAIWKGYFDC